MKVKDFVKSFKGDSFYRCKEWREKRLDILERDNDECQRCKEQGKVATEKDGKYLEVHHIKELEEYPELAFEDDNLITVCTACHNYLHDRFGESEKKYKFWTEERW